MLSRLDYAKSLLAGVPEVVLHKLQVVQNNAARMISRVSGRAHITPVLKQLYWLPVRQRITHKLLTLAFKAINCTDFPSYLGLQWRQLTRQLRSSGRQLVVPRTRTGALVTGPTMWWLLGSGMVYPTVSNCSRHLTLSKDTVIKTRLFREHFEGT